MELVLLFLRRSTGSTSPTDPTNPTNSTKLGDPLAATKGAATQLPANLHLPALPDTQHAHHLETGVPRRVGAGAVPRVQEQARDCGPPQDLWGHVSEYGGYTGREWGGAQEGTTAGEWGCRVLRRGSGGSAAAHGGEAVVGGLYVLYCNWF